MITVMIFLIIIKQLATLLKKNPSKYFVPPLCNFEWQLSCNCPDAVNFMPPANHVGKTMSYE